MYKYVVWNRRLRVGLAHSFRYSLSRSLISLYNCPKPLLPQPFLTASASASTSFCRTASQSPSTSTKAITYIKTVSLSHLTGVLLHLHAKNQVDHFLSHHTTTTTNKNVLPQHQPQLLRRPPQVLPKLHPSERPLYLPILQQCSFDVLFIQQ